MRHKIIPICDHCGQPWAGCQGICAERDLTLEERIANSIPSALTQTPHVGIGGARRLRIAAAVLPIVEAEMAARVAELETRIRNVTAACKDTDLVGAPHIAAMLNDVTPDLATGGVVDSSKLYRIGEHGCVIHPADDRSCPSCGMAAEAADYTDCRDRWHRKARMTTERPVSASDATPKEQP